MCTLSCTFVDKEMSEIRADYLMENFFKEITV